MRHVTKYMKNSKFIYLLVHVSSNFFYITFRLRTSIPFPALFDTSIMAHQTGGSIQKLDESTINRIAAGEVVQRPSAAVKELIENCLDAQATSISLVVKDGGMEILQIQDNGSGIHRDDMTICCERFTTSKLSNFNDLKSIDTFGFRGEALASITHVARVTITSRTKSTSCAYKAKYLDGKIIPMSTGDKSVPKPCAGNIGTTILVEDLFYNMGARKSSFKNTTEEYQRICDVVMKYAVRYGDNGVSFSCKKHGSKAIPDVHANSNSLANIRQFYGANLAKELVLLELSVDDAIPVEHRASIGVSSSVLDEFNLESNAYHDLSSDAGDGTGLIVNAEPSSGGVDIYNHLSFQLTGYISNANYSRKKHTCILFINNRLVECLSIRKVVESIYLNILPKHTFPFIYLSITMPPQCLDVNVHPTKREVNFLHEELVLKTIYDAVAAKLKSSNDSRAFYTQSVLLSSSAPSSDATIPVVTNSHLSRDNLNEDTSTFSSSDQGEPPVQVISASPSIDERSGNLDYQQESVEMVSSFIDSASSSSLSASVVQDVLPFEVVKTYPETAASSSERAYSHLNSVAKPTSSNKKGTGSVNPNKLVRNDYRSTKLEQFFGSAESGSRMSEQPVAGNTHMDKVDNDQTKNDETNATNSYQRSRKNANAVPVLLSESLYCGDCNTNGAVSFSSSSLSSSIALTDSQDFVSGSMKRKTSGCACCGADISEQKKLLKILRAGETAGGDMSDMGAASGFTYYPLAATSCVYESIQQLTAEISSVINKDTKLDAIIKQHVFVDSTRTEIVDD